MKIGANDQFVLEAVHGGWSVLYRAETGNQSNSLEIARFLVADYPNEAITLGSAKAFEDNMNATLKAERLHNLSLTTPEWDPRGSYKAGDRAAYKGEVFEYISPTPRNFSGDDRLAMAPPFSGLWENIRYEFRLDYARKMLAQGAKHA